MIKKIKLINIIFWIIILILSLLYIIEAIKCNVITDEEAYTLALIKHDFLDIINITTNDTHPPLSYFYFKIFTFLFNYDITATKIFATIPLIFILIFGGLLVRKNLSNRTAIIFLIMFFATPPFLQWASISRMYSLAIAFVFFAGIYAYEVFTCAKTRKWILYCLFSVAAAYTHYYALLSVIIIGLMLLAFIIIKDKKLIKNYIIYVCGCIVLYLPWISHILTQITQKINGSFALPCLSYKTYISLIKYFAGTNFKILWFLIFIIYIILFIFILKSKNKKIINIICCSISLPLLTLIIASIVSILIKPILWARYMIFSCCFLPLFLAIGINELISHKRIVYKILSLGMIAILAFTGMHTYYNIIKTKNDNNIPLAYNDKVESYFVYNNSGIAWLTSYYAPNKNINMNFTNFKTYNPDADPFENITYDKGIPQNYDKNTILLIKKDDEKKDDALKLYSEIYDYSYLGTWYQEFQNVYREVDAFMLSKK